MTDDSGTGEAPLYRVAEVNADNAAEMRALFERVFGKPMSETFWHWKYRPGRGHGMGVWQGDELVAHYGGVGMDILWCGTPSRAVQIVDVMVTPSVRHGVRTQSPFFLATSKFLERYLGYGNPYVIGFGFPSDRHLVLARHLKLYAKVGEMTEVTVDRPHRHWSDVLYRWSTLAPGDFARERATLDRLWQAMAASLPQAIVIRKDAERLQQRYLQHPEQRYELWLLRTRLLGTPLAVVAVKVETQRVFVLDAVCDQARLADVLRLAAHRAWQRYDVPLVAWLSSAYTAPLAAAGLRLSALPIVTPSNIWAPGPDPATLQDRWCLFAGDTDYL
ncbi:MAG: GNAT family N-acetyltransferase [Burkholderiaceae bacterium]|jgi:hypothetical protein